MSLFGSSPPGESPGLESNNFGNSRSSLFEDEPPMTKSTTTALFADDDPPSDSPWDMPTPRKQLTRADLVRNLLPPSDVPESYIEAFDTVVGEDGREGRITSGGVAKTLAAARLSADVQARIMGIIGPGDGSGEVTLDRSQFNVLLALIGLAQEGEAASLDGVDERRRSESTYPLYLRLLFSQPKGLCPWPTSSYLIWTSSSSASILNSAWVLCLELEWAPISIRYRN